MPPETAKNGCQIATAPTRTRAVKLFYQSMGVACPSEAGPYARTLAAILHGAAEPGTQIDVKGLGPGKAIAGQTATSKSWTRRRSWTSACALA